MTKRIDTVINVHQRMQVTKVLLKDKTTEAYFYFTNNKVVLPPEVVDHFLNKTITDELISNWFSQKNPWPGFGAEDEIRSEIIRIYGETKLNHVFNFKVIDKISGIDLYNKYPVYGYYQHGDTLHFPEESYNTRIITIEDFLDNYPIPLSEEIKNQFMLDYKRMQIRLESNIFYELLKGEFLNETITCLKMGNASLFKNSDEIHIEPVKNSIKTVFDAIVYRNSIISGRKIKGLPFLLS